MNNQLLQGAVLTELIWRDLQKLVMHKTLIWWMLYFQSQRKLKQYFLLWLGTAYSSTYFCFLNAFIQLPIVIFSLDLRRLSSLKKTNLGSGFPPTLQTKVTVSPSWIVTLISCSISILGGSKSKGKEAAMHTN